LLQLVYRSKTCVHGFLPDRNILTNAKVHVRKEHVLNVDMSDFFPSINFGRVRATFMARPYSRNADVSTVLAQICCFNNQLPQGAPTSPVVANMVCGRLDGDLQTLARHFNCAYTRYADDITFSTDMPEFPSDLAAHVGDAKGFGRQVKVGPALERVMRENGFSINPNKVRLYSSSHRQVVTGLKVNEFPNVSRRLYSQIRAMLHAWEEYGLDAATKEFSAKYDPKKRPVNDARPLFREVVEGKLNYLRMVRGVEDGGYLRFCEQLARLDPVFFRRFRSRIKPLASKFQVFVLECEKPFLQGSAFYLANVGLVTCAHVLGAKTKVFSEYNHDEKYPVNIIYRDEDIDLAILQSEIPVHKRFVRGAPRSLKAGDPVCVLGFPNYTWGQTLQLFGGHVCGFKPRHGIRRIHVDAHIVKGNSGGPVLNKEGEVIGIAVTGADSLDQADSCESGVIPIDAIDDLIRLGTTK
jgi:RNA-directed DNA polymerase